MQEKTNEFLGKGKAGKVSTLANPVAQSKKAKHSREGFHPRQLGKKPWRNFVARLNRSS